MERMEVLEELKDFIEMKEEGQELMEDTLMEDVIFDSITKLGILAFLDMYAPQKRTVQQVLDCQKISDIIDLVY